MRYFNTTQKHIEFIKWSYLPPWNAKNRMVKLNNLAYATCSIRDPQTDRLTMSKPCDFAYANRSICYPQVERVGGSTLANVLP